MTYSCNCKDYFLLNLKDETRVMRFEDIIRCEADGNYCKIFLNSEMILTSRTLKFISQQLPSKNFLRVHKSHLVNMIYVKSIRNGIGGEITLINGDIIPKSRTFSKSSLN